MIRSIFLKTVTLLFFASCISTFLLYRTGKFDRYLNDAMPSLQTSSNGGIFKLSKADSLKIFNLDSNQSVVGPSSKLIKITDFPGKSMDSMIAKRKAESDAEALLREHVYMLSSSKSAQIFTPKKPVIQLTETYMLSSSKSIQVFQSTPILIHNPDSVNAAIFQTKKKTNKP